MKLRLCTLLLAVLSAAACSSGAEDDDGGARDAGPQSDAQVGSADAAVIPDTGPVDAGTPADTGPADTGSIADAGSVPDVGALDGGSEPVVPCAEAQFSLQRSGAQSVWVTGTFTGWAADPGAGAIALSDMGGGQWSVATTLPSGGRHLYKFIVDGGTWIEDPANPAREDDGFGGFNSVLEVCSRGAFEVRAHRTTGATFDAQVAYVGPGEVAGVRATLDRVPLDPAALVRQDRLLNLHVQGLSDGIHDLRIFVGQDSTLLKIYVNESTDWRDTAMYFVMTDRFENGDASNDAPVGGGISHPLADYLGGDFAGVQQRLEAGYFDDLGINTLWLTWPLDNTDGAFDGPYDTYDGCSPNGQTTTKFSGYHGYWPKSGTEIESRFGQPSELESLVDAAHARGIRILFDFTANHVHEDSPYYSAHPEWFNLPAQLCRNGLWDGDLREECWFDAFLPDWNFKQAAARRQVLDDAIELAKRFGADGFRVDALKHMEDSFIRELRRRVEAELEQTGVTFYMVGETFTGDAGAIARYVSSDMLHGQFDFPSNMAIRRGLAIDQIGLGDMHAGVRASKQTYGADAPWMSTFAGNHDIARFISKASGDLPCGIWSTGADTARGHGNPPAQPSRAQPYARLKLAMAYVYAVPGVPLLYYGDEVGLAGAGDPDNRRMLPQGTSLNPQMQSTLTFMQQLGQLRAAQPVLRTGDWTAALFADDDLLVFARTLPGQVAIIVINRGSSRTVDLDVSSLSLPAGATLTDGLTGQTIALSGGRLSFTAPAIDVQIFITP